MAKKRSDYDHGFDLGQFRYDAAAFIKLVIMARAKQEPKFLSEAEYRRWGLEKIADDPRTIEFLLAQAEQQHGKIWRTYIGPHGSGGADPNDPLAELKQDIAFFANWDVKLRDVIDKVRAGKQVKWQDVAHWDRLSAIRDGLDRLPQPTVEASDQDSACPVVIRNEDIGDVDVLGVPKSLMPAQLHVIQALIEVFPATLTKDQLILRSGHSDAVNVLKRLVTSDSDWADVIKLAGKPRGGYALRNPQGD
jgi:hypothetical protein